MCAPMVCASAPAPGVSCTILPGVHHHDAVREFQDLVQILGDQQHRGAGVARRHDARAHVRHGLHVEAEARDWRRSAVRPRRPARAPARSAARCRRRARRSAPRATARVRRTPAIMRARPLAPSPARSSQARRPAVRVAVEAAQIEVVGDRHARHAAVAQRLLGQHPHRARLRLGAGGGVGFAGDDDLAGRAARAGRPAPRPVPSGRCPRRRRRRRSRAGARPAARCRRPARPASPSVRSARTSSRSSRRRARRAARGSSAPAARRSSSRSFLRR